MPSDISMLIPPRPSQFSSRLGGFHIIVLAAFTLLGFYVCFKQIKALSMQINEVKQASQPPSITAKGSDAPLSKPTPGLNSVDDLPLHCNFTPDPLIDKDLQDVIKDFMGTDPHNVPGIPSMMSVHSPMIPTIVSVRTNGTPSSPADITDITDSIAFDPRNCDTESLQAPEGRDVEIITEQSASESGVSSGNTAGDAQELEKMSLKDLKAMAAENGITFKSSSRKADVIASILGSDKTSMGEE